MVPLHEFLSVADRGAADRETLINLKWILGQMTGGGPCPARASVGGVVLPKSLSKRLHGVPGIGKTEA